MWQCEVCLCFLFPLTFYKLADVNYVHYLVRPKPKAKGPTERRTPVETAEPSGDEHVQDVAARGMFFFPSFFLFGS